jgi:predicted HNH restriction endonuclease
MKCWNIRDETTEALENLLKQKYAEIKSNTKAATTAATIEEAKYYIEAKFKARNFANNIETELLRRRINYGEEK